MLFLGGSLYMVIVLSEFCYIYVYYIASGDSMVLCFFYWLFTFMLYKTFILKTKLFLYEEYFEVLNKILFKVSAVHWNYV